MQEVYQYESYGAPADVLKKASIPIPTPGPGEVLIKVMASALNPVDFKVMGGHLSHWPQAFPIIPGWDAAGVIEKSNSDACQAGDEVFVYTRLAWDVEAHPESQGEAIGQNGTLATYLAVPAWKVARKPAALSFEQAASVPLAGLTAYHGLHDEGGLKAGQTALVLSTASAGTTRPKARQVSKPERADFGQFVHDKRYQLEEKGIPERLI